MLAEQTGQFWTKKLSTNVPKTEEVVILKARFYREIKCNKVLFRLTSLDNKYPHIFAKRRVSIIIDVLSFKCFDKKYALC